jgi:hypothetical protein
MQSVYTATQAAVRVGARTRTRRLDCPELIVPRPVPSHPEQRPRRGTMAAGLTPGHAAARRGGALDREALDTGHTRHILYVGEHDEAV